MRDLSNPLAPTYGSPTKRKRRKVTYKKDNKGDVVKTVTRGKGGAIQPKKIKTKTYSKTTGKRIHKKVTTNMRDNYEANKSGNPRHVKKEVTGRGLNAVVKKTAKLSTRKNKDGSYDSSAPTTQTRKQWLQEHGRDVLGISKQDSNKVKAKIAKRRVKRQNKKVSKK